MSDSYGSLDYQAYADRTPEAPHGASNIRPVPRISIQAFCLDDATVHAIEAAAEDRRMQKAHVKLHKGGIPAAIEHYAQAPTPNLIVLECNDDRQKLLHDLDQLAEYCDAGTKVVVIGKMNDVGLYRELVAQGISEYLVAPIDLYQFIGAIGELYGEPGAEPLGRTIAFFGVKGGCGASTVAHNCAWTLARNYRNEVTVADLDLPFGTAGLDYNQDPLQGIYEAVSSPDRLDETYLDRILSKCSDHLSLLAAPATLERAYDFNEGAFEGLIDIMRSATPTIVLDVPHTWNGWTRQVLTSADELVVVAEPDLANLRNAKNVIDSLKQLRPNDGLPHLVLNRTNMPKRPEIKPEEFATALGLKAQMSIPFDPQLFGTAANNGQMIAEVDAKNPVSDMFNELAQLVSGRSDANKAKRTVLKGLLSKLTRKSA
ncbi:CpaE family protein [Roseibium sp. CAU 1637]|uniref:CpaE family protein n=2 Tax=Stappiaceae TaxID=2821832 RepID=A0A939EPI7_9HYPH|nr:CpaE family protein [Roseibium limicola]